MITDWSFPEVANPCPVDSRHRSSVCAIDAGNFAEQSPLVLIDHHYAILPRDKHAMIRRIWHDVIPAPVSTQIVSVCHTIRRRLPNQRGQGEKNSKVAHELILVLAPDPVDAVDRPSGVRLYCLNQLII